MRRKLPKSTKPAQERPRNIRTDVPYRGVGGIPMPNGEDFLQWESYLERLALRTLLLCTDVTIVGTQPPIAYRDDSGAVRSYTPDIQIEFAGNTIFIEVKPLARLLENNTRERLSRHAQMINDQGFELHYLTDDQLDKASVVSRNVNFLAAYTNRRLPDADIDRVRKCAESGPTIGELVDPTQPEASLAAVYIMIANKQLMVSFQEPITPASRVSLPHHRYGGLLYAQVRNSGRHGAVLERLVLEGGPEADRCLAAESARGQQRIHHRAQTFW